MKALYLLLKIAKIKEDQAMARARKIAKEAADSLRFQGQVIDYAKDYEKQILDGGKAGTKVAFIQDADAFRTKLLESAKAMDKQVKDLQYGAKSILDEAIKAKMRAEGLEKLANKEKKKEEKKRDKAEEAQFEDLLAARASINSGMKDA
jgi:flagellar biosynthesis chaperone FliJ